MRKIWKPILILLIVTIMGVDVLLDRRAQAHLQAEQAAARAAETLDLPVGTGVGELAPDFSAQTLDGETVQLSDFRGQLVVVNLFASWCGPCRAEMPHLVQLAHRLDPDEVAFVGLNLQETPAAVADFQTEFAIPFPLLLDEDGRLTQNLYLPVGLPTSWFIDAQGVVCYVFAGPMTADVVENILADIQAGRAPDPFG